MIRVSVNIPFPGFYGSDLEYSIDREHESHIEYESDRTGDYSDEEKYWPEPLRLDDRERGELLFSATDYSAIHQAVARSYLSAFDDFAGETFGFSKVATVDRYDWKAKRTRRVKVRQDTMQAKFEEMTSPREYNFATDRLFASVPLYLMQRLFKLSRDDGHETLAQIIKERFTSRSGFISHYSNRLADWTGKPLAEWDYNELGTLLLAAFALKGLESEDVIRACVDVVTDGDGVHSEWSDGVDWDKFTVDRTEARREKLVEWVNTDPEAVKIWAANHPGDFADLAKNEPDFSDIAAAVPYRCDRTPDMFAGVL